MSTSVVSPATTSLATPSEVGSRLAALQACIAALRVQTQAMQNQPEKSEATSSNMPMVRVFDPTIKVAEGLCMDRDASKRDEKILDLLRERGAYRVLGALASPQLAEAIEKLHETHANCSAAVDYLLTEEVLARQRGGALTGVRLLLHGGAGVGKTDFALTLAKLLKVPAEVISLSAAQAAAFLAGSEQYWSNTQPGLVWKQLIQGAFANPIIVLDEIDKVTDRWGDPLGALYQLLESRSASIFCDKSVPWLPIDASSVNWVATANDVERLHPAIRSRFVEVEISAPTEDALCSLVQKLYFDLLAEFSLTDRFAQELTGGQARTLVGGSVRDAKRILRAAVGHALRENLSEIVLKTPQAPDGGRQRIGFL